MAMPGFELDPVDGGSPIHLPQGESVLGRGPFLGVNDKRVSRHHGLLENLNGQLRIKPTHLNPCFSQSSLDAPPQPLGKDQWHPLRQGDIFSLLPGKFIYRVIALGEDGTLRNSEAFEEEEKDEEEEEKMVKTSPVLLKHSEEPAQSTPLGKGGTPVTHESTLPASAGEKETVKETHNPPSLDQTVAEMPESSTNGEKEPTAQPKKRVLPAWMMGLASDAKSPSTPKGAGKQGKKAPAPATPAKAKRARPKQARAKAPSSEEEELEHSDVEQTARKRVKSDDEDEAKAQDVSPAVVKPSSLARDTEMGEESDNVDMEKEEEEEEEEEGRRRRGTAPPKARARNARSVDEEPSSSDLPEDPSQNRQKVKGSGVGSSSARVKAQPRTRCPYGNTCYRKNPMHFQESSHPGDSDYEEEEAAEDEEEEDEDADRPECPYGTDCYRKNPLHKKQYKHTKPPAKGSVPDEDDEDDYDDSFINDDSEDAGSDSDYAPPESVDSGQEDVKRLQKEARAFLRKKK